MDNSHHFNDVQEESKMEINKNTNQQAQTGLWAKLPTEQTERKPRVEFEVNSAKKVRFLENEPREFVGDTGAYYIFNVEYENAPNVIITSAFSLLRGLKLLHPLAGKEVVIVKKIEKGKNYFEVSESKVITEKV